MISIKEVKELQGVDYDILYNDKVFMNITIKADETMTNKLAFKILNETLKKHGFNARKHIEKVSFIKTSA